MIVMHATVGPYQSSLNWLCAAASKVSSHYVISKQGHIAQLVPDARAAWHAGASVFGALNSEAIRDGSLGIELENLTGMELPDGTIHPPDPYPEAQLIAARSLVRTKMAEYMIPPARIVRHADIAVPKGRKTDPAGLDWPAFLASITTDPLRTRSIAGLEHPYFCGDGFFRFYADRGGLPVLGYPLMHETRVKDRLGDDCTIMACERACLKFKPKIGAVELALLSEVIELRWLP
jgi:hypothetical protein